MSLLMDALKKAEEAKRQSEAAAKAGTQPDAAAPTPAEGRPQGLPELPSRLELLDHEFASEPARREPTLAAPAARAPAEDAGERTRAAAQNVFQAKQSPPRRSFPLIIGGATLLALLAIGGYVWWELQPKGGLGPSPVTARTPSSPTPIAAAPASPPALATVRPIPDAAQAAPAAVQDEKEAAVPPRLTFARPAVQGSVASAPAAPAAAPAESPIRITTGRPKVNPQLASAYQAFQSGDLAAARRDYEQVLKQEPKNTDALHGLAAISLRQGQPEAAEDYYLRILEADPKDGAAHAALIGLRGQLDPLQSESRLKNLLAGQPESAALHFALGNLYARQGRWNEAQQAYFRAYAADSENPDYQFNLAVSLDQLRQPKLALQYYQGALAAAAQRPAAFDQDQVAGRVSELQK